MIQNQVTPKSISMEFLHAIISNMTQIAVPQLGGIQIISLSAFSISIIDISFINKIYNNLSIFYGSWSTFQQLLVLFRPEQNNKFIKFFRINLAG